jgi:phospholipase C
VRVGYHPRSNVLHLQLRNEGARPVHFQVSSNKIYGPLRAVAAPSSGDAQPAGCGAFPVPGCGAFPTLAGPGLGVHSPSVALGSPAHDGGWGTQWNVTVQPFSLAALSWELDSTGGWYDFVATSSADDLFSRRVAGRIETGRHSRE